MGDFFAGMDQADDGGKVFRYNGSIYRYEGDVTWTCVGKDPHCIIQIHCMAEIGGQLWTARGRRAMCCDWKPPGLGPPPGD